MGKRKRSSLAQVTDDTVNIPQKRLRSNRNKALQGSAIVQSVKAGSILKMVLKNFMCHSHLEVVFNSNINYVTGRNGSGKSAILTALVVGLGGKATLTNRGSSIKGFIKNEKNTASVEITICNSGPLAYKNETFGNQIVIERVFRATGSGSYKIKSMTGQVISTRAKEIQHICSSLNIQIDNPVCLLNQDTSRNFLNTTNNGKKFQLFMKATGLEQLLEEYNVAFKNKEIAKSSLKEKEKELKKLEGKVKELKAKIVNHQNMAVLKAKVGELHKEQAWAKVKDIEDEIHEKTAAVKAVDAEIEAVQNQLERERQECDTISIANNALNQQIRELQDSITSQNTPQNIIVKSLGELKEEIHEKTRQIRLIQKEIALKSGNCGILEKEIQQFTENFSQLEQNKIKRMEDMKSLELQIQKVESSIATSKNDQLQTVNSLNQIREQERAASSELRQLKASIENTELEISSLKKSSNNSLSLYGRDMGRVINAIKKGKSKFIKAPRGPLGSYIKLKDKKWTLAVESFITPNLLCAFTVDNKKDNLLLMKIFDDVWNGPNRPSVITSKFFDNVHNVNQNLVQTIDGCVSIYNTLEITDAVVANCLIDQLSIESMLLIPNSEKAIKLMSDMRRVPKNCRQGITINGDKYYPDPNYKFYSSRYHNAKFLQVSIEEIIFQLEGTLKKEIDKKEAILNQYNVIKSKMQQQSRKDKELQHNIVKFTHDLEILKQKHNDLENAIEPDASNVNGMEKELAELRAIINEKEMIGKKLLEDLSEVKRRIEKKEGKLSEIKTIVRGYEDRISALNSKLQDNVTKCKENEMNKKCANKKLMEFNEKLISARKKLDQTNQKLEEFTRDASTIGSRPNVLRQVIEIMTELKQNEKTIRSIESKMENIEEILKKYRNLGDIINLFKTNYTELFSKVKDLQLIIDKRKRRYQITVEDITTRVKHSFEEVLNSRQFKGTIEIDMDKKTLNSIVIPQQGSQGLTLTSNLSGGERSFSTVAFLYSLWQCNEFPFYFLDEFDVFMDKVNRSKVIEILVSHAKSQPDLQFVFLTPQDVSFINDESVSIHKLSDPERRAT